MLKYLYIVYSAKPGGRLEPWGPSSLFKRSRSTRTILVSATPFKNLRSAVYGGSTGGQFVRSSGQQIVDRRTDRPTLYPVKLCRNHGGKPEADHRLVQHLCNIRSSEDHRQIDSRSSADRQQIIRSSGQQIVTLRVNNLPTR